MTRAWQSVRAACSYFSIFPIAGSQLLPAPDAASLAALPLVGAAVGAAAGGAAWLASRVVPGPLVVATAFTVPIVLTGAIHLDGFLDCSDAVFASVAPERRLEILKDPAHGTYALAAGAVVAAWSLAALATVAPRRLPALLAFSGALSRLAAVWNARIFPYARGGAASSAFLSRPNAAALALETVALGAASFAFSRAAWTSVPLCCIASRVVARALAARLGGGLVGDAYGFLIVALEPAVLVLVAATFESA